MAFIEDIFVQNWKSKFPNHPVPLFPVLESTDNLHLEQYLQKCNETIANLNRQLKEQEFIASFIWDLIHNYEQISKKKPFRVPTLKYHKSNGSQESLTSYSSTPEASDDLDNAIPIQFPSPTAIKQNEYTVMLFNEARQSMAKQNSVNSILDIPVNKTDQLNSYELSRKKSMPELDNSVYVAEFNRHCTAASSLKQKTNKSLTKPVPIPRTSLAKIIGSNSLITKQNSTINNTTPEITDSIKNILNSELGSVDRRLKSFNKSDKKIKVLLGDSLNEFTWTNTVAEPKKMVLSSLVLPTVPKKPPKKHNDQILNTSVKNELHNTDNLDKKNNFNPVDSSDDDGEDFYQNILLIQNKELSRVATYYSRGKPNFKLKTKRKHKIFLGGEKDSKLDELQLSSESVRSVGSDAVFDEKSPNLRMSIDSQSDADDLDYGITSSVEMMDDESLKMRKWVLTSILESEKIYLGVLDILMQYMTTFKNLLNSPQIVIGANDIETIFCCIPQLHLIHKMFVHQLAPKFDNWTPQQQIAEPIKILALEECRIAPEYLKNFSKAVATIHRCWIESPQFEKLTKEIKVKTMKEEPSIEELLHKPVLRFQRNTLVIHDLIKCTPSIHPDYDTLQKTLTITHDFLETLDESQSETKETSQRYLAKQGILVEKIGNIRKLRYLFLFNDMIVCARQKINAKQKMHFDAKWYIALVDLAINDKSTVEEERLLLESQQQEIEALQKKIADQQADFKNEIKIIKNTNETQGRNWSFHNRSKNLEKRKKYRLRLCVDPTALRSWIVH